MKKTCGLDVHKDNVFCGIYNGKHLSEVETFTTTTVSIRAMGDMSKARGVKHKISFTRQWKFNMSMW